MSNTTSKKSVVAMAKKSEKFALLVEFFESTHKSIEDGYVHLKMLKAKLKRFIFQQIELYKSNYAAWYYEWVEGKKVQQVIPAVLAA